MGNYSVIVLDFETTGLSPNHGDRAIEIGAVLIENNRIVNSFQKLMNPGFRISSFIESYTGISNSMVEDAAPCEEVMEQFADFVDDYPLVAHNASFDTRFWIRNFSLSEKRAPTPLRVPCWHLVEFIPMPLTISLVLLLIIAVLKMMEPFIEHWQMLK